MTYTIQLRRDLAANWTTDNPVLAQGELGVETDTWMAKVGDGSTAWTSLGYWRPSKSLITSSTHITSNYTASATDFFITADPSGGNITVTVPVASAAAGRVIVVSQTTGGGNLVLIKDTSSNLLGATFHQYESNTIQSDGTAWYVTGNPVTTGSQTWNGQKQFAGGIVASGLNLAQSTQTASYSLSNNADTLVLMNGSNLTATLPTAAFVGGEVHTIKNINSSNLTLATTSSQTIDGVTSLTLYPNTSVMVQSDGSNWRVIASEGLTTGNMHIWQQAASTPGLFVVSGNTDTNQYSNFELADNVFPVDATGHYWAFSHRDDHSFRIFNYNGSSYTNVFFCGEDGSVGSGTHSSQRNLLDDGANGNMRLTGYRISYSYPNLGFYSEAGSRNTLYMDYTGNVQTRNNTLDNGGGAATFAGEVTLAAGTASAPPLLMQSGTNLTTPAAGAIEYDGTAFYATAQASSRQVLDAEQFITLTSAYTLTSQTAAQKMFNATTNGALTVEASTTYYFECFFTLSAMSATSGSFGFALGGTATLTSQLWETEANKATLATAASAQNTVNTAANTTIATASTATVGWAKVWGKVRVNAAGTLIPQVSLGVAAAAIVGADSYFRIWPVGSSSVTNVGDWS